LDVTRVESISRQRTEQVGSDDVLGNSAGVLLSKNDDVLSITVDDYQRTFERICSPRPKFARASVPGMARAGYGRAVDVSSRAGQFPIMRVHAGVLDLESSIGWQIQR
jgi:NADP-dependent 3-hydroxy acid dehydrogenase YdfG